MLTQEIIFGVTGQSFFYDAPEGRASAASCTVYLSINDDDGATESATTGSASCAGPNTTLSASAAIGDTSLTVLSGTGITRGRRYLLTDTDGDREWIECISISGTTVGLRHPLKNDYASGSTFQDCRITVAVDPTWVATKAKISDILDMTGRAWRTDLETQAWPAGTAGYRIRWVYTVAGVTCLGVSYADLVRYQAKNLVTPLDVDDRFPNWIDRLPTDHQENQGQSLIDEAFRAVKLDAMGDDQVIRRIRNTEVLRELVIQRANVVALEASLMENPSNIDAVNQARDLYERRYKQLVREPKVPTDQTGGGASAQATRLPAWRR